MGHNATMKSNSSFDDRDLWLNLQDVSEGTGHPTNESTGAMDMVERDRFELLSAYLDGEVTAAESRQVEEWLENDASVQCLYTRLLNLRQGLRSIPVPAVQQSSEVTAHQVLKRVQHRRLRLIVGMGGTAVAACVLSAVSTLLPGVKLNTPQLAQKLPGGSTQDTMESLVAIAPLMVALNNPVIESPQAAMAYPENSLNCEPHLGEK